MATSYAEKLKSFNSVATNEINPQYNSKVTALKNSLAANKLALTNQKTGVNQNYDTQVANQNISNDTSKGNFSDSTTDRGLGRSSVAVTGLAEMDQVNNRYVGAINSNRTGALGQIDSNIALEDSNFNNTFATMEADKQTEINNLAHTYADKQVATEYQAGRDKVADNQWTSTNNYNIGRDKVADTRYNNEQATDNSRYAQTLKDSQAATATDNSRYKSEQATDNSRYQDTLNTASAKAKVAEIDSKITTVVDDSKIYFGDRIDALTTQMNAYNSMGTTDSKYLVGQFKKAITAIKAQEAAYIKKEQY